MLRFKCKYQYKCMKVRCLKTQTQINRAVCSKTKLSRKTQTENKTQNFENKLKDNVICLEGAVHK